MSHTNWISLLIMAFLFNGLSMDFLIVLGCTNIFILAISLNLDFGYLILISLWILICDPSSLLTDLLHYLATYYIYIYTLQIVLFQAQYHGFIIICNLWVSCGLFIIRNIQISIDLLYSYLLGPRFIYWIIIFRASIYTGTSFSK